MSHGLRAGILATVIAGLAFSCSLQLGQRSDVSFSLKVLATGASSGRVLLDDEGDVYVEAHTGSATGALASSAVLPLTFNNGEVSAQGTLSGLTVGTSVVLVAEVRNSGVAVSRDISNPIVVGPGISASLVLVPLDNHPRLDSVSDNTATTVPLDPAAVRFLRLNGVGPTSVVSWDMPAYPDVHVTVYDSSGAEITPTILPGNDGYSFASGAGSPFLMFYNGGGTVTVPVTVGSPAQPLLVVGLSDGTTRRSLDNGVTWVNGSTGLTVLKDLRYAGGNFVAAGSVSGVYSIKYSSDGATWSSSTGVPATTGEINRLGIGGGNVMATGYYGSTVESLFSSDGGQSFTVTNAGVYAGGPGSQPYFDGLNWYLSNSSGSVFQSNNGGVNWNALTNSAGMYQVNAVMAATGGGTVVLLGANSGGALKQSSRTLNSGVSWSATTLSSEATGYFYDVAYNGVYVVGVGTYPKQTAVTTDFGATWGENTVGSYNFNRVITYSAGFLAGDSSGELFYSTQGALWDYINPGVPNPFGNSIMGLAYRP